MGISSFYSDSITKTPCNSFLPYFYWPVWHLPSLNPPLRLGLRLIPQLMLGTDTMAVDTDMADTDMATDTVVTTDTPDTDMVDTTEASVMPKLTPPSWPQALPLLSLKPLAMASTTLTQPLMAMDSPMPVTTLFPMLTLLVYQLSPTLCPLSPILPQPLMSITQVFMVTLMPTVAFMVTQIP